MADLHAPLRELDRHFADFIQQLAGEANPPLYWAAALVSRDAGQGHVCLELQHYAGQTLELNNTQQPLPALQEWHHSLQAFPQIVGQAGDYTPLILEQGRLYLGRYWLLEQEVAAAIGHRASQQRPAAPRAAQCLNTLFPDNEQSPDWQKVAAAMALLKPLLVISGGPGTGKTSTVVRILALINSLSPDAPRILLAAPTGKAAHRLQQSISAAVGDLPLDEASKQQLQLPVQTLHRLLGIRADGSTLYQRSNPLHAEWVVVDEVSMVDLSLMQQLLDALPQQGRLLLLGDRNQLASVEAGSVLGDICARAQSDGYSAQLHQALQGLGLPLPGGKPGMALNDCIVQLQHSYRFRSDSGIGQLAAATLEGDLPQWQATLQDSDALQHLAISAEQLPAQCQSLIREHYLGWWEMTADVALEAMQAIQILAVTREGPLGVKSINQLIEHELRHRLGIRANEPWYPGRPVMVMRNDYRLKLFNGDVGITLADPANPGQLRVWFRDQAGQVHGHHPARLPAHETAYAITVHKSQGSEYQEVILVLPQHDSPLLSRELIYTAISRAKQRFQLWGDMGQIGTGIGRRVERQSGLIDKLWHPHE